MTIELLDGNEAAAYAARLSRVKCIPHFPITPQTEITEMLAQWHADGLDIEFNGLESEHSVLSAALGSEMMGSRTFTATSSQGLMLMHEVLPIVSGTRMPLVMVNVSRGLSAPITLWSDHNDFLAMRDSGWLMFAAETNQEILDSIILAYKISENKNVLLPSLINMDGFIHSYTRTEVDIPLQKLVDRFLPPFDLEIKLDTKKPLSLGVPAMENYMFFKSQMHKAQLNAFEVIKKVQKEWYKLTKRKYDFIEKYKLDDAKIAIIMIGANTTIARSAVELLRKENIAAGLLRIRVYRPFPIRELKKALRSIKRIIVFDQNIAPGSGGILYPEIKSLTSGLASNCIFSLGGKPVSDKQIANVIRHCLKTNKEERIWLI